MILPKERNMGGNDDMLPVYRRISDLADDTLLPGGYIDFNSAGNDGYSNKSEYSDNSSNKQDVNNDKSITEQLAGSISNIANIVPAYLNPITKQVLGRKITPTPVGTSSSRTPFDNTRLPYTAVTNNNYTAASTAINSIAEGINNSTSGVIDTNKLVAGIDIPKLVATRTSSIFADSGIDKLVAGKTNTTSNKELTAATNKLYDAVISKGIAEISKLSEDRAEHAISALTTDTNLPCGIVEKHAIANLATPTGTSSSKLNVLRAAQYAANPSLFAKDIGNRINKLANNPSVDKVKKIVGMLGGGKQLDNISKMLGSGNMGGVAKLFGGDSMLNKLTSNSSSILSKAISVAGFNTGIASSITSAMSGGLGGVGSLLGKLNGLSGLASSVSGLVGNLAGGIGDKLGGLAGGLAATVGEKIGGKAGGLLWMASGMIQNSVSKAISGKINSIATSYVNKAANSLLGTKAVTSATVGNYINRSMTGASGYSTNDQYTPAGDGLTNIVMTDGTSQPCGSIGWVYLGDGMYIPSSEYGYQLRKNVASIKTDANYFTDTFPTGDKVLNVTSGRKYTTYEATQMLKKGIIPTDSNTVVRNQSDVYTSTPVMASIKQASTNAIIANVKVDGATDISYADQLDGILEVLDNNNPNWNKDNAGNPTYTQLVDNPSLVSAGSEIVKGLHPDDTDEVAMLLAIASNVSRTDISQSTITCNRCYSL